MLAVRRDRLYLLNYKKWHKNMILLLYFEHFLEIVTYNYNLVFLGGSILSDFRVFNLALMVLWTLFGIANTLEFYKYLHLFNFISFNIILLHGNLYL